MRLSRTVAPSVTPITLAEAKAHLRISSNALDTLITNLINTATEYVDGRYGVLRRALVTQTWKLTLDNFPAVRQIELPLSPLQSVTSVEYYDLANTLQTFDAAKYHVHADEFVGRITIQPLASWPSTYDRPDAVFVTFVAGFGAAAAVPAPIKQALLLYVAALFSNPEGAGDAMPPAARHLLAPFMVAEFPQ